MTDPRSGGPEPCPHNTTLLGMQTSIAALTDAEVEALEQELRTSDNPALKRDALRRFLVRSEVLEEPQVPSSGIPVPPLVRETMGRRMVGCERPDGTLNIHAETETCDMCLGKVAV